MDKIGVVVPLLALALVLLSILVGGGFLVWGDFTPSSWLANRRMARGALIVAIGGGLGMFVLIFSGVVSLLFWALH